jgi:hypothetical protein
MLFACPKQIDLLRRSYGSLSDADANGVPLPCNRLGVDQPRRNTAVTLSLVPLWHWAALWMALVVVL